MQILKSLAMFQSTVAVDQKMFKRLRDACTGLPSGTIIGVEDLMFRLDCSPGGVWSFYLIGGSICSSSVPEIIWFPGKVVEHEKFYSIPEAFFY